MTDVRPGERVEDKSLGELVALASSDVSRLIRSEIELAKLELKDDAKKGAMGGTLFAVAGVIACVVVILVSISIAYGLVALGIWHWLAFLIVAVAYVLLALALVSLGYLRMRKISGIKRTRKTLKDDLAVLRRSGDTPAIPE
ncbi:MAG: hypothetical protein JWO67_7150 [Streptosporangiaceae bacterium]|jgi:uncharacterized membrane protein YqjE|nr:hypothetical protein [Streptosporangiaceae bacterium]